MVKSIVMTASAIACAGIRNDFKAISMFCARFESMIPLTTGAVTADAPLLRRSP